MSYITSSTFQTVLMDILHIYGLFPESKLITQLGQTVCGERSPLAELCTDALFLLCGFDSEQFNRVISINKFYKIYI